MFLIVGYYLFSAISIPLDLMFRLQPIKFYLKPNKQLSTSHSRNWTNQNACNSKL